MHLVIKCFLLYNLAATRLRISGEGACYQIWVVMGVETSLTDWSDYGDWRELCVASAPFTFLLTSF